MATVEEHSSGPGCHVAGTVIFAVGGRTFQISERLIRSRGQNLLSDLLDDPAREGSSQPVYVEGDSERFRYVLDWFRYGKAQLPPFITLSEMKREFAFYGIDGAEVNMGHSSGCAGIEEFKKRAQGLMVAALRAGYVMLEFLSRPRPTSSEFPLPTRPDPSIMDECSAIFRLGFDDPSPTPVNDLLQVHGLTVHLLMSPLSIPPFTPCAQEWKIYRTTTSTNTTKQKGEPPQKKRKTNVHWKQHTDKLIADAVEAAKSLLLLLHFNRHSHYWKGTGTVSWIQPEFRVAFVEYLAATRGPAFRNSPDWLKTERAAIYK